LVADSDLPACASASRLFLPLEEMREPAPAVRSCPRLRSPWPNALCSGGRAAPHVAGSPAPRPRRPRRLPNERRLS
jgi:hypothetical protein